MTTREYLLGKGVTMDVARDFLENNLDDLHMVYSVYEQYGVNNDMIADILQPDFTGLNSTVVSSYFDSHGLDGARLGFDSTHDNVDDGVYSGSYSGDQTGTLQITVNNTVFSGTWYSPSWDESGYIYGSVDNNTGDLHMASQDEDSVPISFIDIFDDEPVQGVWSVPGYGTGIFSAELA